MNMKKALSYVFLALALLCAGASLPAEAADKTLGVTYVKSPLNIPSIIEKRLGLLEAEFSPLSYVLEHPEITSGAQQTQAIAAGSVQVANCVGGTSLLLAASQGLDIRIAGIYFRAPKTYVLLVKDPAIKTIQDLKGKKIGGPKGTVLHQLLLAGLGKSGLPASDVEHIEMPIPTATAALMSGSIDGALAAGPAAAKAIDEGARVLFDGDGLIEGTVLIGVDGKTLEKFPELPRMMVDVHRKALAYNAEHPDEALAIISEETGISPEQVTEMAKLYDFDPGIREGDLKDLRDTMQFLMDAGLATKYVDPAGLVVR